MALENRAISGVRAKLFIGSTEVGFATGVSVTENIAQTPVELLGEINVVEYEPVGRTVSMTASVVRLKKSALRDLGLWPSGGTIDVLAFGAGNSIDATLIDVGDSDNQVFARVKGLKPESLSWRVDRAGVSTVDCTFRAIQLFEEAEA